jgi:glucokinase
MNDNTTQILGLDIGGTKSAAIVGTTDGKIIARTQWRSNAKAGPQAMIAEVLSHAQALLTDHPGVARVGVSIGGPLDVSTGMVLSPPNLPGWDRIPLRDLVALGLQLPVAIEHDASAAALAEWRWGFQGRIDTLVYLTCGTGMGAGIIINGRVHRGAQGHVSDIGHWPLRCEGPIGYGKPGTFEGLASGGTLPALARFLCPTDYPEHAEFSVAEFRNRIEVDDPSALEVMRQSADVTGRACAMIADFIYPDVIVLGSLSRHLGPKWVERVQQTFKASAFADAARLVQVMPSNLGDQLQDLAALAAAGGAA